MKQTKALLRAFALNSNAARGNLDRTDLDVEYWHRVASFPGCKNLTARPERHRFARKKYPTIQLGESPSH